jgi:lysophospholipase L1-like esterase
MPGFADNNHRMMPSNLRHFIALALVAAGCAHQPPPSASSTNPPKPLQAAPAPAPDLPQNPPAPSPAIHPNRPTIFIAGDSTAARGRGEEQQGWGVPFADYFDLTKVGVVNAARGGRSSRTFITEGLWDGLLAQVKAGDLVLIQFGINDAGAINDATRARGSIPGLGAERQEIDNLLTKQHEVVHTYGWYLRKMIADTKAKGAAPIVLGLTIRNVWKDGKVERSYGRYSQWAADTAKAEGAPFLDVPDLVADKFEAMGEDQVKALYIQDHTHFNAAGADIHAATVVSALKGLNPDPVRQFLSVKGHAVEADRIARLNLPRPANPALPTLFLIGDSTVRNGEGDGRNQGEWGWGDFLATKFDTNRINIVNQAIGGLSSRTYLTQGHWERVLAMMKKGDFVMMQFGHNDGGAVNDTSRARASLRGSGDETQEIDNLLTHRHEVVHTYGWYLRKFISDARAAGVTPLVCSLIPRQTWRDGKIVRNKNDYAGWAGQTAQAAGAPFVDINEIIAARYDELGPAKTATLFVEGPHTNAEGAELNAQCVMAGLKALPDDPLAPYLLGANP